MSETFDGTVSITPTSSTDITISLDAQTGDVVLGNAGKDGDITLQDGSGQARISLDAARNNIMFQNSTGGVVAMLGSGGDLRLGGSGSDGDIRITDTENRARIVLDGNSQRLRVFSADGNEVVRLGDNGNLKLGGIGMDGDLGVRDREDRLRINLDGDNQRLRILASNGEQVVNLGTNGNLTLGGGGNMDGDLALKDASGNNRINFDAQNHEMTIRDSSNSVIGSLGRNANLRLGSNGHDGDILLYPSSATNHADNAATIHLDANAGDITLRNADCAEEFDIASPETVAPGTVMSLNSDGRLVASTMAFERAVVGVVSGAGAYKPGIVLDRQPENPSRQPIALIGKTFVRVNDEGGSIAVGDLLTSSSTPGVAMRTNDPLRAFGAVIGKAIATHDAGDGMIPMVIALQ